MYFLCESHQSLQPEKPFNPIHQVNPNNPPNPINRYNLDRPFTPLNQPRVFCAKTMAHSYRVGILVTVFVSFFATSVRSF
jgi:hypothetical protein